MKTLFELLLTLSFVLFLFPNNTYAQKGPPLPPPLENRIVLTPEVSPSIIPNSGVSFPIKTIFSFTNTNFNSNTVIQNGDKFRITADSRVITSALPTTIQINSSTLTEGNFQVTDIQVSQFTITYFGQPAVFAPGDTISVGLAIVPAFVAGAGNFIFEVLPTNLLFYNTPKQFVRLSFDVPVPAQVPPGITTQFFNGLQQTPFCLQQPGAFTLQDANINFAVNKNTFVLILATIKAKNPHATSIGVTPIIFVDGLQVSAGSIQTVNSANSVDLQVNALVPVEQGFHTISIGGNSDFLGCFAGQVVVVAF